MDRFKFLHIFLISLAAFYVLALLTGSKDREIRTLFFPYGDMQNESEIKFKNPIVRLSMTRGSCTAWIVDKNYAVTAAHCINHGGLDESPMSIFSDVGEEILNDVKAVGYEARMDLGLITGNFSAIRPLKVNFTQEGFPLHTDHKYISCGYPLAQKHIVCTAFIPTGKNFFRVEGESHLIPGMSGGPVIDFTTGEAVAVNSAVTEDKSIISPVEGFLGVFGLE